jgi:hypothetical protein
VPLALRVAVSELAPLCCLPQSAAAREGGLDVSLFKLLSDAHPQAVAALETQVRPGAGNERAEGQRGALVWGLHSCFADEGSA